MNEELQSTNDELHATNDELHRRTSELYEVNAFLEAVLTGLDRGVVVVDQELLVRVWNDRAHDMWGLREQEVLDRNLLTLDIGLPVDQLRDVLRQQLQGGDGQPAGVELAAHDRRGRAVTCRVTCTPLRGSDDQLRGVIMLMELSNPSPAP